MRNNRSIEAFLKALVRAVPQIEAPPFFAARMASVAVSEEPRVFVLIQNFASRLVPVFLGLIMLVTLLLLQVQPSGPDPLLDLDALLEQPSVEEPITMENVLTELGLPYGGN